MQILNSDSRDRSQVDRKTATDVKVRTLKALASQHHVPVLTISSVGRNGYGKRLDTSMFKESGDIEFTGGVLLGYNWSGVTDSASPNAADKEEDVCKERGYRWISIDLLKSRNSERGIDVKLKYYPAFNYFEYDQQK
jgi:replicative DNA helicase